MKQLELPLSRPRQRSRSPRASRSGKVRHSTRAEICGPGHIVLRIERGLPDLRTPRALRVLEGCFRAGKEKLGFRLVHYSIQRDHLHLVVEADDRHKLARGMQALEIRIAKRLNRHWHRVGRGRVFAERYFVVALVTYNQTWRTV